MRTDLLDEYLVFSKHLNFTKAAAELNVSQSALSKHIAALEKELQVKLVSKTSGGKLELTQAGVLFVAHAQRISDDCRAAFDEIGSHCANLPVRLQWFSSPDAKEALSLIAEDGMPFSLMPFYDTNGSSYFSSLLHNRSDIVYTASVLDIPPLREEASRHGIATLPAGRTLLSIVLPASHPLAVNKSLSRNDLSGCTILMPDAFTFAEWRSVLAHYLVPATPSFALRPLYGNIENIEYTEFSDSLFIYQSATVETIFANRGDVRIYRQLDGEPIELSCIVAYRKDNPNPNVELLARRLSEILEGGPKKAHLVD